MALGLQSFQVDSTELREYTHSMFASIAKVGGGAGCGPGGPAMPCTALAGLGAAVHAAVILSHTCNFHHKF